MLYEPNNILNSIVFLLFLCNLEESETYFNQLNLILIFLNNNKIEWYTQNEVISLEVQQPLLHIS